MNRSGPTVRRHKSEQSVETPEEFIGACEDRFGKIGFDLAAERGNQKCQYFFSAKQNALSLWWNGLTKDIHWLNPPYGNIGKWAEKCVSEHHHWNIRILMLVPASVGSEWFANYCYGKAAVWFLRPRIQFVGHTSPYPKDLMLVGYGIDQAGCYLWEWK